MAAVVAPRTRGRIPSGPGHTGARRAAALATVLALVSTACGTRVTDTEYQAALDAEAQRAPVTQVAGDTVTTGGQASDAASVHGADPAAGTGGGDASDVSTTSPDATSGGGPPPATGTSTSDASGEAEGSQAGEDPGTSVPGPATPTSEPPRVTALSDDPAGDVVTIGLHVPMTGAAPLPTDWTKYLDVIVSYVNDEVRPAGRTVHVLVEDDGYDPSQAMAACRRLADAEPLFVIGHTMPAAQDACAGFFDSKDIPYLMRGTTPAVLQGRPLAFFGTTPDDVQGRLLADYVMASLDGANTPVGVLYQNDQVAAKDEFVARLDARGASVVAIEEGVPKQSDYAATIQKLRDAGAEIVLVSAPPVDAIKLSVQSSSQGYHPTWLGGGSYWNYNMVLESAGMAMDGAVSFSPWPAIDAPAADEFRAVYASYRPTDEVEDIGLVMWGWMMLVVEAMDQTGPDLSPRSFTRTLRALTFDRPYWNPVSYGSLGQAGSDAVAVLRADGNAKRWRQVSPFARGF